MGSTVDEPEMFKEPVISSEVAPVASPPSSSPPHAAATSESDIAAATSMNHVLPFPIRSSSSIRPMDPRPTGIRADAIGRS